MGYGWGLSAVLCLPACLRVRRSVPCGQAPTGTALKHSTASEVPSPSVQLGAFQETKENSDPENPKSIAECRGGP